MQEQGWALLEQVFTDQEVRTLDGEISQVFETLDTDVRSARREESHYEPFRYEMLNRSALAQEAIGHPAILATIEPLLGEDFHVIANTAWRQAPDGNRHGGRFWHIDAGPHLPRPAGVAWDDRIPYPIFAIGAHIFLMDCPLESRPTGVISGSHKSGQAPPGDRLADASPTSNGIGVLPLTDRAGDVALFVSNAWHRRLPSSEGDPGRSSCCATTADAISPSDCAPRIGVNPLSPEAIERASTPRGADPHRRSRTRVLRRLTGRVPSSSLALLSAERVALVALPSMTGCSPASSTGRSATVSGPRPPRSMAVCRPHGCDGCIPSARKRGNEYRPTSSAPDRLDAFLGHSQ